jgi:hypothetical protein
MFVLSKDTQTTGTVVRVKRPHQPSGLLYGFLDECDHLAVHNHGGGGIDARKVT